MTTWTILRVEGIEPEEYLVTKQKEEELQVGLGRFRGGLHEVLIEMTDHFDIGDLVCTHEGVYPVCGPMRTGMKS